MILVTGGTGFVGSHLLFHLVNMGEKVRVLKRKSSNLNNVYKVFDYYKPGASGLVSQIEWFESDLSDYSSLVDAMQDIQFVYHVAALVSFNTHDRLKMNITNVTGTSNIVNAAIHQNVRKLCYMSSVAAFAHPDGSDPVNEDNMRQPGDKYSAYSSSKYKAELEVWRGIAEGLDAVILNPSVIMGYYSWSNGSSNFFPLVNRGMNYYPSGSTGFVDVKDVVNIMIRLMHSNISGERFCINSENLSYRDLLILVSKSLCKKEPSRRLSPFFLKSFAHAQSLMALMTNLVPLVTIDTARSAFNNCMYSNKKIKNLLNYEFIPLSQTVKELGSLFLKESNLILNQ